MTKTYDILENYSRNENYYDPMQAAVSKIDEGYIGDIDYADMLSAKGIVPQLANPDHKTCSIGFCESQQAWYGWSHRAIYGFKVGSKVSFRDCAYKAPDKYAFGKDILNFFCGIDDKAMHSPSVREYKQEAYPSMEDYAKMNPDETINHDPKFDYGVLVEATYVTDKALLPNEDLHGTKYKSFTPYPEEFGRGEWEALTLDDAKQMAIDFAEGVN